MKQWYAAGSRKARANKTDTLTKYTTASPKPGKACLIGTDRQVAQKINRQSNHAYSVRCVQRGTDCLSHDRLLLHINQDMEKHKAQ